MRQLTFLALFLVFVNAEFSTSMFLKNLKSIKKMHISYEDAHENKKRITVNMDNKMIADELIIFSEAKRQTSLKEIKLAIPDKITSIEIEYINKNDKFMSKFMGIALDDRAIDGDNLYLYKDKDFNQQEPMKEVTFSQLFENANKPKKVAKKRMEHKVRKMSNSLDIEHSEHGYYIDIHITNCGNKTFGICDEVRIPKIVGGGKIVVFYFNIEKAHKKMQNVSKNIKRIEVGYNIKRDPPTHLVIELYKKIVKVEKMYTQNGELSSNKSINFEDNHKKISYRLYIK